MKKVTNPALIEELERVPVADKEILAQLEGAPSVPSTAQRVASAASTIARGPVDALTRFGLDPRSAIGVGRGLTDVKEGIQQTGLDVAATSNVMATPRPRQLGQPRFVPISPEESQVRGERADDFTQRAMAERQFFENTPVAQSAQAQTGRVFGNLAPAAAVPSGPMIMAPVVGATFGATQFVPETDRTTRGLRRARGATFGAAAGTIIPGGLKAANAIRNIPAKFVRKRLSTAVGQQGEKLSKDTGIDFLLSEKTGSKTIQGIEEQTRRGGLFTDRIVKDNNMRLKQSVRSLVDVMRKVTNKKVSPEQLGLDIEKAVKNTVKVAQTRRSIIADRDFGKFRQLAGDKPVASIDNFKSMLEDVVKSASSGTRGEKEARRILRILDKQAVKGKVTAEQLRKHRSQFSLIAAGKDAFFKDIADASTTKVGRDMVEAINKDFSQTAKSLGKGELSAALNKANANFEKNTKLINDIEDSVIGKLIGSKSLEPTKLAGKVAKMTPGEIRSTMSILHKRFPETVKGIQQHVLREPLRAGFGKSEKLAGEFDFDPAKTLAALPKKEVLREIFPGQMKEVMQSIRGLQRISVLSKAPGGSEIGSIGRDAAGIAASGDPTFIARWLARVGGPLGLTKKLFTPEGRKALITLTDPAFKNDTARITAAIMELTGENSGK